MKAIVVDIELVLARGAVVCGTMFAGAAIGCGGRAPVGPCFDKVDVSVASAGQRVAVGDTVKVSAATYVGPNDALVRCGGDIAWAISDSTIARLEPTSRAAERIARGLRVGTVTIQATIAGRTGQSPLNFVP